MYSTIVYVVAFVVALALAAIPAVIASKKYYSGALFYVYGVLAFLPALIHSICLPDQGSVGSRRVSQPAVIFAGLGAVTVFYNLIFSFIDNVQYLFMGFNAIVTIYDALCLVIGIVLSVWLLVCLFRCDMGKMIMINFVAYAVFNIFKLIGNNIVYISFFAKMESDIYTVPQMMGIYFMRNLPSGISNIGLAVAYAIFALFVYRLNAKKSVEPKALFCFLPLVIGVVVNIISSVLIVFNGNYYDYASALDKVYVFFLFLFLGIYCLLMSNVPSTPIGMETTETAPTNGTVA